MKCWFRNESGRTRWTLVVPMILGGLALAVLFAFLFGWVVMLLWNWLMPEIFGLPTIGYWQAWGLVVLAHILVKPGYASHNGGGGKKKGGKKGATFRVNVESDDEACESTHEEEDKDEPENRN